MQMAFDFGARADVAFMRERLIAAFSPGFMKPALLREPPLKPIDQLVKSLISSRTLDEISKRAFERLGDAYPQWSDMARATVPQIEALIFDVEFPKDKAEHLLSTLRAIEARHPDFNLDFLNGWPIGQASAWLEVFPGIGPKVAASVLNFSTLNRDTFVVDTHILRILRRFGFTAAKADIGRTQRAVMDATDGWTAGELLEFHVMMKWLGQKVCCARITHCPQCPLRSRCGTGMRKGQLGIDLPRPIFLPEHRPSHK